ncbi:hypothetical protein QE394_001784 [Arthrobacter sp. SORGH_AS 212]|jgi:hypothetical protein|nr:hypothetical protein [Arthrobacter sp. SORGH_AS_0212]
MHFLRTAIEPEQYAEKFKNYLSNEKLYVRTFV